jgi:hypothetical protein
MNWIKFKSIKVELSWCHLWTLWNDIELSVSAKYRSFNIGEFPYWCINKKYTGCLPVLKVCIMQRRYQPRNFDAFYIFTIKFLKSPVCNFLGRASPFYLWDSGFVSRYGLMWKESILFRKLWVVSDFLPQQKLTGWVRINIVIKSNIFIYLFSFAN